MAITSVKTGSSFTNLQKYDSMLAGNAANGDSATWLIQRTTVGSGGSSSINFSSIPSTYTHLQIRYTVANSTVANHSMQFNGDTASNYSWHEIYGDGVSAASANGAAVAFIKAGYTSNTTTTFSNAVVIDILDYANTNKFKTSRSLGGSDINGATGYVTFRAGNWRSTTAINSILIYPVSGSFAQYSTFALYGVK